MSTDFGFFSNITFWCGFFGWLLAQGLKFVFNVFEKKRLDIRVFARLGGMPSSHSSLVGALATSVGFRLGFSSAEFALAFAFASIVMFDAQSVRRAAGVQAQVLNEMLQELFQEHHLSEKKLVEFLGHTPLEVLLGMLMGVSVAMFIHGYF